MVYQDILTIREQLKSTLKQWEMLGEIWANKKASAESIKARRVLELKDSGFSATIIDKIIKGDPQVNQAIFDMDVAKVKYDNAYEAINILKKDFDFLREQYSREWSQAGRD